MKVEDVAAYLLDRADQYSTGSGLWIPLVDAAKAFVTGEVQRLLDAGELQEPELHRRVRKWKAIQKRIDAKDAAREQGQSASPANVGAACLLTDQRIDELLAKGAAEADAAKRARMTRWRK